MPRVAWAAIGAVVAAVVATPGPPPETGAAMPWPGPLVVLGAALLVGAAAAALRRADVAAIAVGATLVGIRVVGSALVPVAPPAGPLPPALDHATLEIASLSAPSEGVQRGTAVVVGGAADGVRLYFRVPRYPELAPGDRISTSGSIRPPPEGPGFGDYLRRAGIGGTLTAREIERMPAADGPAAWLERRRRDAGELLAGVLPAPQAGLAAGILIGLRDQVDRTVTAEFTAAGLTHIVAISGWNIAVVGGALAAVLRRASRRRRSVATLAAIATYSLAAGLGASVIRAALMAGAVLGSRELGRPGTAASALGIATLGMLIVDPSVVADAGFQLSVAATAGLLAWGTPLTRWLRERLAAPDARVPAPGWLLESLGVSLAAQAATLPLVLLDFGRVSLVSPLANLVAAPLIVPVMAVSAAALVAGWAVALGAPGIVGGATGAAGAVVLGALVGVGRVASSLPGASVTVSAPATYLLAALATAAVAGLGIRRARRCLSDVVRLAWADGMRLVRRSPTDGGGNASTPGSGRPQAPGRWQPTPIRPARAPIARPPSRRRRERSVALRVASLAVASGLAAVVIAAAARPDGRLQVAVLDVGQGDAILVQDGRGGRILVDTGPDPDLLLNRLDERIPAWDRRIDLLVLTHPHEDHVGGAALLLERYRVGRVVEAGMPGSGPGWSELVARISRDGRTMGRLAAGDRVAVGAGEMRVLWPDRGSVPATPGTTGTAVNDVSIVLDLRFGARRFLLMGDAEQEVDAALLARGVGPPRVDLLKVAHHGSRTASTARFLAAIRPRVAAISVGTDNDYGHPAPETLDRLAASGARVLRTDRDGTILASTDGADLRIETATSAWMAMAPGEPPALLATGATAPSRPTLAPGQRADSPGEGPAGCIESARDPLSRRSRVRPARVRPTGLVRRPCRRGRGDRRVPRRAVRGTRGDRGSRARRGSRAPPRHRQAAAGRRPGSGARPWGGGGSLAEPTRIPGARPRGRRAPHHPPPRRGPIRAVERRRDARGADHRVLGQARGAATRGDERAVRGLGGAVPRASREPGTRTRPSRAPRARGLRDRRGEPARGASAALGGACHGRRAAPRDLRHRWTTAGHADRDGLLTATQIAGIRLA